MSRINPTLLTRYRDKMSMEELSRRSGINKSSIFCTEKGERKSNNAKTIEALAKALKIEPEALTATEVEPVATESALFAKTKLTMQISAESRNALFLVAMRYNVKITEIVEFAPLLFHLAASENLKQRGDRLAELRAARDSVSNLYGNFRHIDPRLISDPDAEVLEGLEEKSIRQRDLRSLVLDEDCGLMETRSNDYEDDEENPFIVHLRERLAGVRAEGSAESADAWSEYFGPRFAICFDEARAFFGGDEDAADDLVHGRFSVTDIPKDIRSFDKAAERIEWANAHRQERAANVDDLFISLGIGGPS